jgi:hypothetical protein
MQVEDAEVIPVSPDAPDKFIRVYFTYRNEQFCLDRQYNDKRDDQGNCDDALAQLVKSMHSEEVVPALRLITSPLVTPEPAEEPKAERIFMNMGMLAYISVTDVRIYRADPTKGVPGGK